MWAMTKNLARETRAQGHPVVKVGLGVLTAVVAFCTVLWVALKLLPNVTMSLLKIANAGVYAALQNVHLRLDESEHVDSGTDVPKDVDTSALPDGLPTGSYDLDDPRCWQWQAED